MRIKLKLLIILLLIPCSIISDFSIRDKCNDEPQSSEYMTEDSADIEFTYNEDELYTTNTEYSYISTPEIDDVELLNAPTEIDLHNIAKRDRYFGHSFIKEEWETFEDPEDIIENFTITDLTQEDPAFFAEDNYNFNITISYHENHNIWVNTTYPNISVSITNFYNNGYKSVDEFRLWNHFRIDKGEPPLERYYNEWTIQPNTTTIPNWDQDYPLLLEDSIFTVYIRLEEDDNYHSIIGLNLTITTQHTIQASAINLNTEGIYYIDTDINEAFIIIDPLTDFEFNAIDNTIYTDTYNDIITWIETSINTTIENEYYFLAEFTTIYFYTIDFIIQSSTFLTQQINLIKDSSADLEMSHFHYNGSVKSVYINTELFETNLFDPSLTFSGASNYIPFAIVLEYEEPLAAPLELISITQLNNITTSQNIQMQYVYKTTITSYCFSFYSELDIISISSNTTYEFEEQSNYYIIIEPFLVNTTIEINLTIDPNFNLDYTIESETNQQTEITIEYSADLAINHTRLLIELPRAYLNWSVGTQNSNNILSITNVNFTTETQELEIIGQNADPSLASFYRYDYDNSQYLFTEDFDENVEFRAYINFTDYNFAFELPIEDDWILDGVHYEDDDYLIEDDNTFYAEMNPSISNCYLSFSVNPIEYFKVRVYESIIRVIINTSVPLTQALIVFTVNIAESYKVRDNSVIDMGSLDETDYYSIIYDLEIGQNIIEIPIQRYNPSSQSFYLVIFGVGGASVGFLWYYNNHKKKKRGRRIFVKKSKKK